MRARISERLKESQNVAASLTTFNEEDEERWDTYNLIVDSLIKNDDYDYIAEMKYRVTDGENLNEIMLNFIERNVLELDGLVWLLKRRIEEYLEDDFMIFRILTSKLYCRS